MYPNNNFKTPQIVFFASPNLISALSLPAPMISTEHMPTRYPGFVSRAAVPRSQPTPLSRSTVFLKDMPRSCKVVSKIFTSASSDSCSGVCNLPSRFTLVCRWRISLATKRACTQAFNCSSGVIPSLRQIVTHCFRESYHSKCFSFWKIFATSLMLIPWPKAGVFIPPPLRDLTSSVKLTPILAYPRISEHRHRSTPSFSNIRSSFAACVGVTIVPLSLSDENTILARWRFSVRSATEVTALKLVPRCIARRSVKDIHVAHVEVMCDTTKLPTFLSREAYHQHHPSITSQVLLRLFHPHEEEARKKKKKESCRERKSKTPVIPSGSAGKYHNKQKDVNENLELKRKARNSPTFPSTQSQFPDSNPKIKGRAHLSTILLRLYILRRKYLPSRSTPQRFPILQSERIGSLWSRLPPHHTPHATTRRDKAW